VNSFAQLKYRSYLDWHIMEGTCFIKPLTNKFHGIGTLYDCHSVTSTLVMDKHKLTGQTLGRVFNSRGVCVHAMHLLSSVAIRPNLELKTRPKQLLGSLPLDIALPALV
jgi:hypothetical protein